MLEGIKAVTACETHLRYTLKDMSGGMISQLQITAAVDSSHGS